MKFNLLAPDKRHWLWVLYLPLYIAAFFWVESYVSSSAPYWVSCWPAVDNAIPFCPPFVLAYYVWLPFMVAPGLYYGLRYPDCFRRYMQFIIIGFTASIVFFCLFPNGQNLRPASFSEDNIFTRLIGLIYAADTNTNVLPSIHTLGSTLVVISIFDCPAFKPWFRAVSVLIAIIICASTVFIKQHSILDFFAGILLAVPLYFLVYVLPRHKKTKAA